ncbi:MAG: DUF2911 domain-containing protein [Saprospiraceae bacterium]|nr:DUF2911 domain-containing protein [Saprospiraceae bacterium]
MKNLLLIILLFVSFNVQAQYRMGLIPRVSPTQEILNTVGYTEVGIQYSSPSVKNRDIWGDLVPYGKIWRAGANEATKLTFSKNVLIGGNEVPSGSYALFIIPQEHGKWTVILNEVADQWGAFSYDSNKDVLRMEVLPRFNISYEEKLRYEVVDIGFEYGIIRMQWENVEMEIEFMTQFNDNFINKIQTTSDTLPEQDQWVVYLQGAEFLAERKQRLDTAASWISMAEINYLKYDHPFRKNEPYYLGHIHWIKALVSVCLNNDKDALTSINKLKELDGGKGYYSRSNNKEVIDLLEKQLNEKLKRN